MPGCQRLTLSHIFRGTLICLTLPTSKTLDTSENPVVIFFCEKIVSLLAYTWKKWQRPKATKRCFLFRLALLQKRLWLHVQLPSVKETQFFICLMFPISFEARQNIDPAVTNDSGYFCGRTCAMLSQTSACPDLQCTNL